MSAAPQGTPGQAEAIPFAVLLGLRGEKAGDGRASVVIDRRPELMNKRGVYHGGVLATMLDSVMARAARSLDGVASLGGTTDLHVQFMRPGEGSLRAEGWIEHAANTLAFCRGEVRNEAGELVATGTASIRLRRAARD